MKNFGSEFERSFKIVDTFILLHSKVLLQIILKLSSVSGPISKLHRDEVWRQQGERDVQGAILLFDVCTSVMEPSDLAESTLESMFCFSFKFAIKTMSFLEKN